MKARTANKQRAEKTLPFDKQIMKAGMTPNLISAALIFGYATVFISMRLEQLPWAVLIVGVIVLFAEFVFSPLTNGILTKKLTADIERWRKDGIGDYKERTMLFERLMSFPLKKGFQTFLYFFICATLMAVGYHLVPQMGLDIATDAMSYAACLFGSYYAGLLAHSYSEGICIPLARQLVKEGIDTEYALQKKTFGMSTTLRAVLFLVVPTLYASALGCLILFEGYFELNGHIPTAWEQIVKIIVVEAINLVLCITMYVRYYRSIKENADKLSASLSESLTSSSSDQYLDTSLGDGMQYNVYLLNTVLRNFHELLASTGEIGEKVRQTTDSLSDISSRLSATSLEQNAAVKEILATMEDSSALTQNISNTIEVVSADSERTYQSVSESFGVLESITQQMKDINAANMSIMEGIQELEKQVGNIGQVISIINDIADQTRIIAFNAELEAVSAGDEGQNFHIVATEIRRLAGSTMDSITEIKDYIQNIQDASQKLIVSSQYGTQCIQEENALTEELERQFVGVKDLADVTASKSSEIAEIVNQQSTSFGQIVITLRQISASIEGFTGMTKTINDAAQSMQKASATLATLQDVNR